VLAEKFFVWFINLGLKKQGRFYGANCQKTN
jgi:hypothetical protein